MRRSIALPVILSLAFAAEANDTGELSLRSKALVSATSPSMISAISAPRHADAPFSSSRDPLPQMLLLEEQEARVTKSVCETTARDFCYDLAEGRVVYRAARGFMPTLAGLSPEGVALRRNRIVLRYSFR